MLAEHPKSFLLLWLFGPRFLGTGFRRVECWINNFCWRALSIIRFLSRGIHGCYGRSSFAGCGSLSLCRGCTLGLRGGLRLEVFERWNEGLWILLGRRPTSSGHVDGRFCCCICHKNEYKSVNRRISTIRDVPVCTVAVAFVQQAVLSDLVIKMMT